jgi:SNF2 family DNA or RNA helicase
MTITPFQYQLDGASRIAASSLPLYNVFEPGLGKSCTAILVARDLGFKRVLIFCPLSATYSWKKELAKFWPNHPPVTIVKAVSDAQALARDGVFIVTYGLMSRSDALVDWLKAAPLFDLCVMDEAHALKNSSAKRTRAILSKLRQTYKLAHPMSATPAPNHAGELWPVLRSLRPDLILNNQRQPMTKDEFEGRYCEKKTIRQNGRMIEVIVGTKNAPELRARLNGFFLRETKANVLKDLPPLDFVNIPVQIADPERYQTVGQLIESGEDDKDILEHARMMANSTRYRELGLSKAPMVAEFVRDMLDGGVEQVTLWAIHHEVIDYLHEHLNDFGVSVLDGRHSQPSRDAGIEKFVQGKTRVFLGQIAAGGTAITLSGGARKCCDAVFAETDFSPKMNWQAACRIHRIGQRDGVLARFMSAAGTYDDRIQEILARKTKDFSDVFEGQL